MVSRGVVYGLLVDKWVFPFIESWKTLPKLIMLCTCCIPFSLLWGIFCETSNFSSFARCRWNLRSCQFQNDDFHSESVVIPKHVICAFLIFRNLEIGFKKRFFLKRVIVWVFFKQHKFWISGCNKTCRDYIIEQELLYTEDQRASFSQIWFLRNEFLKIGIPLKSYQENFWKKFEFSGRHQTSRYYRARLTL